MTIIQVLQCNKSKSSNQYKHAIHYTQIMWMWNVSLLWRQVSILAICATGSNHEYTLSEPIAVLRWLIVLTGSTWVPFHPRKTLYHVPQGYSIPGKSSPMNTSQYSSHFTGSHHEVILSEPSSVAHSTDWLYLDTFPPMEDALPRITSFFNTWKISIIINTQWAIKTCPLNFCQ